MVDEETPLDRAPPPAAPPAPAPPAAAPVAAAAVMAAAPPPPPSPPAAPAAPGKKSTHLLFGKWDFTSLVVKDPGLIKYLNIKPIYAPHTSGRHANKSFAKQRL